MFPVDEVGRKLSCRENSEERSSEEFGMFEPPTRIPKLRKGNQATNEFVMHFSSRYIVLYVCQN